MAKSIKVSQWNGLPLYGCPYCPYNSTTSREDVEQHAAGMHADQVRFDELLKMQRKEAEAEDGTGTGSEKPNNVSGDLPAGSAGARPGTPAEKESK